MKSKSLIMSLLALVFSQFVATADITNNIYTVSNIYIYVNTEITNTIYRTISYDSFYSNHYYTVNNITNNLYGTNFIYEVNEITNKYYIVSNTTYTVTNTIHESTVTTNNVIAFVTNYVTEIQFDDQVEFEIITALTAQRMTKYSTTNFLYSYGYVAVISDYASGSWHDHTYTPGYYAINRAGQAYVFLANSPFSTYNTMSACGELMYKTNCIIDCVYYQTNAWHVIASFFDENTNYLATALYANRVVEPFPRDFTFTLNMGMVSATTTNIFDQSYIISSLPRYASIWCDLRTSFTGDLYLKWDPNGRDEDALDIIRQFPYSDENGDSYTYRFYLR